MIFFVWLGRKYECSFVSLKLSLKTRINSYNNLLNISWGLFIIRMALVQSAFLGFYLRTEGKQIKQNALNLISHVLELDVSTIAKVMWKRTHLRYNIKRWNTSHIESQIP